MSAIFLSLRVATCAVGISLIPGVLLALWLARSRSRLRGIVETVVVVPLVLPPVVSGIALLSAVSACRLDVAFTWWAAVLASAIVSAPLLIRTVRAGRETLAPRLAQAAATLGASPVRIFATVTLPLIWPALVGGAVLAWARALGEFGATLIVAGNIPGETRTMPLAMYTDWQAGGRSLWPLALVAVGLALAAVSVGEWLIRRGGRGQTHAAPSH